jgi:thiamine kinase-like enzyme
MEYASLKRISALPCWQGAITVEPLAGGLSNESYKVTDAAGAHVVRFGEDFPFHHVSRERELMVATAAHQAGFAPAVQYSQPGVMVTQFVAAKTLTPQDICAAPEIIARFIRSFHESMGEHVSGPGYMFWVFHVIRDYARTLMAGGSRMGASLPGWLAMAAELERVQVPLPVVFGHNDLLAANFLDDGDRLWLIDFEYAGYSTAMFDLAGVASNSGMDEETAKTLLGAYFGREPDTQIIRSHDAMQCASLLRETMWSLVSELFLNAPGVDYASYSADNLERLEAALARYQSVYGKLPA